jgi:phi13 family phage major tail protein
VVIAPLKSDTETEHTYGELQLMAGAIEASITPENADPDVQYADDIEFDTLYPDPELTFSTSMADIPLSIQEQIFGNQIDDNGVLVRTASDRPPYFAVGFKSEKSDGTYRFVWLYKVRAKPMTENYKTKEGQTITARTARSNGRPSSEPMTGAIRPWRTRARMDLMPQRHRLSWRPSTSRRSQEMDRNRRTAKENLPLYMNIWSTPRPGRPARGVLLFWTGGEKHGSGSAQAKRTQSAHWGV